MDTQNEKKKWFDRITADVMGWARLPNMAPQGTNRVEALSGGPKWRYTPNPQQLKNEGFTDEEIEARCGELPK